MKMKIFLCLLYFFGPFAVVKLKLISLFATIFLIPSWFSLVLFSSWYNPGALVYPLEFLPEKEGKER